MLPKRIQKIKILALGMRNSLSAAAAATTKNAGRLNACEAVVEERDNGAALEDVGNILLCRFGATRPIYTLCDLSL